MDPLELLHTILPMNYVQHLAKITVLYVLQKGQAITVSCDNILQFLGLLLMSGYHKVPTEDLYWSTSEDTCQLFLR